MIKSIFGKEDDITLDDLQRELLNKKRESYWLEGKSILSKNEDTTEKSILKPLIGFLNSEIRKGLLIFGADTDKIDTSLIVGLSGVPNSYYSLESLESSIREYIASVPKMKSPYVLRILPVSVSDLNTVYLVEIKLSENDCVCYSKKSKLSYIRKVSSTETLTPEEFMVLAEKRTCAQVYLEIDSEKFGKVGDDSRKMIQAHKGSYPLHVSFKNTGSEPTKEVWSILNFLGNVSITKKESHGYIFDEQSSYNNVTRFSISSNIPHTNNTFYPEIVVRVGTLIVKENVHASFELAVRTHCDKGYTLQHFKFTFTNRPGIFEKAFLIMEEDMSKREFVPYISRIK